MENTSLFDPHAPYPSGLPEEAGAAQAGSAQAQPGSPAQLSTATGVHTVTEQKVDDMPGVAQTALGNQTALDDTAPNPSWPERLALREGVTATQEPAKVGEPPSIPSEGFDLDSFSSLIDAPMPPTAPPPEQATVPHEGDQEKTAASATQTIPSDAGGFDLDDFSSLVETAETAQASTTDADPSSSSASQAAVPDEKPSLPGRQEGDYGMTQPVGGDAVLRARVDAAARQMGPQWGGVWDQIDEEIGKGLDTDPSATVKAKVKAAEQIGMGLFQGCERIQIGAKTILVIERDRIRYHVEGGVAEEDRAKYRTELRSLIAAELASTAVSPQRRKHLRHILDHIELLEFTRLEEDREIEHKVAEFATIFAQRFEAILEEIRERLRREEHKQREMAGRRALQQEAPQTVPLTPALKKKDDNSPLEEQRKLRGPTSSSGTRRKDSDSAIMQKSALKKHQGRMEERHKQKASDAIRSKEIKRDDRRKEVASERTRGEEERRSDRP